MLKFAISAAGAGDIGDVAALFRAYAASLPVDLAAQGFIEELAELPGAYAPPHGALLLARAADGRALGCVALRPIDQTACELKRLYVVDAGRGAGLGKALVAAAIAGAQRLGYQEIKLDTLDSMEPALALYRSAGFTPVAPYGTTPYPGLLCLGLTLSEAQRRKSSG